MKVLLAGATGYLGQHIAQILKYRLIPSVFIGRNTQKLISLAGDEAEFRHVEVTDSASVRGCCNGIDVVISTVGITRQKDGLSYMDVDFQANINLLEEAIEANVSKFIYVSVFKGDQFQNLKLLKAKEAFVDKLKSAPIASTIIRPNGFYSDMEDFFQMAKKGKVFLFGDGRFRLNPIHGSDLAEVCVDSISLDRAEITVGGPKVYTQTEIAQLAFQACGSKPKIVYLPDWVRTSSLSLLRIFTPERVYGPVEFFLTVMGNDYIAPIRGQKTLDEHFMNLGHRSENV